MAEYQYTASPTQITRDAGQIKDYLAAQGLAAEVTVAIASDGTTTYRIETEATEEALRAIIVNYVRTKTERETLREQLAAVYPKLREGTATNREVQVALAGALRILRDLDNG